MSPEENKQPGDIQEKKVLRLEVTDSGMAARLIGDVEPGADRADIHERINDLVAETGVRHGLLSDSIKSAVEILAMGRPLPGAVIARGSEPEPGTDAHLEILVEIQSLIKPKKDDKGKVDIRDRGALPLVKAGTPLAKLHPATKGTPGRDVFDKIIPAPHSKLLKLIAGRGVELEKSAFLAVASVDGMVSRPEEDKFEVLEILTIDGDVDFEHGHIDFPGLVVVRGAVLPDFRVRCKNLEVETMEPGSMADVAGDMVVHGGIMRAAVKVGGSVSATYVRQARMVCGGDLVIENELLQTRVQCGGYARITSGTGRIVNSHLEAVRGVLTTDIVSTGKGGTVIRLGVSSAFVNDIARAKRMVKTSEQDRAQLNELLIAQRDELVIMEGELRDTLAMLKDPAQADNVENLKAQISMIKPLRENLKEGLAEGEKELEEMVYQEQRLLVRIVDMESMLPTGVVWLDVRGKVDASTEIKGPHASMVFHQTKSAFSIREVELKDAETGKVSVVMRAGRLREEAR